MSDDSAARANGVDDPYDALSYESRPYPVTQPGHLAALAVLHGLEPAEVTHGRVLELGCASGGNIVPLAARFPEAHFVGLDLSARHIAEGQARIRDLDLANIELRQADLATCAHPSGTFDTIICHGVYSWVPQAVQDAILRMIATCLAPEGVAYVSYNTYPGWHLRQATRDIFRYHVDPGAPPQQQVAKGVAMLTELSRATDATSPYGQALRAEMKLLSQTSPSYIMGEYLAPASTPCYFHEFVARANEHGLAYLSEARLGMSLLEDQNPDLLRKIRRHAGDDPLAFEQYADLFLGRQFRRSVLVRGACAARVSRAIPAARLAGLHLAISLDLDIDASSHGKVVFRSADGRMHIEKDPDVSRALEVLAAIAPRTMTPEAICNEVIPAEVGDRASREDRLVEALLRMIKADFGTVSTTAVAAGEAAVLRPRAWQVARRDAAAGHRWTTNLGHQIVALDELMTWVVRQLDGEADVGTLARRLIAAVNNGDVDREGVLPPGQPALLMADAADAIRAVVERCARTALLDPSGA